MPEETLQDQEGVPMEEAPQIPGMGSFAPPAASPAPEETMTPPSETGKE